MPRDVTVSESKEIEEDLILAIEKSQKQLERLKNRPHISLSQRLFHLEYSVVAPLYYRLENHMIDWCTNEHPIQRSKIAKYRKANRLKFKDPIPLQYYRDEVVHQFESSEGPCRGTCDGTEGTPV